MCRNVKENKLLFVRAFDEWIFDMQTSKTRKPFDRMVAIATRFRDFRRKWAVRGKKTSKYLEVTKKALTFAK